MGTLDLDLIERLAKHETDGWTANNGDEPEMPEAAPHIITYYAAVPPRIAFSPATIIERDEVVGLITRLRDSRAALKELHDAVRDRQLLDHTLHVAGETRDRADHRILKALRAADAETAVPV